MNALRRVPSWEEVILGLVLLVVAGDVLEDLLSDPLGGEVEGAKAGRRAVHRQGRSAASKRKIRSDLGW